jgi:hypothetical protein
METNSVFIYHGSGWDCRFTLGAYKDQEIAGFIKIAISLCSSNDMFSRKTGRENILSKLESGKVITLPVKSNTKQTFYFICTLFSSLSRYEIRTLFGL